MNRKFKFLKFLMLFVVFAAFLGAGSKVLSAQEFVLYKVTYHSNYTPASPDVTESKYNDPNFTAKAVGTDAGEVNFNHPSMLYVFKGWSTTSNDSTVEYKPGDPIVFSGWFDQNKDLYAVWERVQIQLPYSVTYHCNYTPAVPNVIDSKFTPPTFTVKDVGTDAGEANFKHPMLLFYFKGWSTTPDDGTVEYNPGDTIDLAKLGKRNVDLYAVWGPRQVVLPNKLTYHANYPPGSMILSIDHEESHFAGSIVTTRPASTYANADGTKTIGGKLYEFAGWSTATSGGAEYYPGETFIMPAKNVDLYGVWTTKPVLNKKDHFAYMQGYPNGTFGQTRNMLRSEAVVMFSRLLTNKMNETTTYTSTYVDIPLGRWYSNQIGYMQQKGVLSTPAPYFRPDDAITRAEFADLACGFENLTTGAPNMFSDVPNSHPYYDQINYAVDRGWLKGYPDGTFRPDEPIQRAEVIAIVNRVLERYPDQAYIDTHKSMLKQYTDMNLPYWAYYLIMEASNGHDYIKDGMTETWTSLK